MNQEWPQEVLARFLQCPVTGEGVAWAEPELLRRINRAVEAGTLVNRIGVAVEEPMDAALVDKTRPSVIALCGIQYLIGSRPEETSPNIHE